MDFSRNARQSLPPIHTVLGDQLRLPTSVSHSPHSSSSCASFYTCEDGSESHFEPPDRSRCLLQRSSSRPRASTITMPPILNPSHNICSVPVKTYSLPTTPVPSSPNIFESRGDNGSPKNTGKSRERSPQSALPFSYSILRPSPSGELITAPQVKRGRRQRKNNAEIDSVGSSSVSHRRHVCSICQKTFNRPSSLQTHLSVHTGSRPFQCLHPSCTKVFSVASNMRRHFRKHHAHHGERTTPAAGDVRRHVYSRVESLISSDGEDDDDEALINIGEGQLASSSVLIVPQTVEHHQTMRFAQREEEPTANISSQFNLPHEGFPDTSNTTYPYRQ